jgi:hypothetical protein
VKRTDSTMKWDLGEVNGAVVHAKKAAQRTDSTM